MIRCNKQCCTKDGYHLKSIVPGSILPWFKPKDIKIDSENTATTLGTLGKISMSFLNKISAPVTGSIENLSISGSVFGRSKKNDNIGSSSPIKEYAYSPIAEKSGTPSLPKKICLCDQFGNEKLDIERVATKNDQNLDFSELKEKYQKYPISRLKLNHEKWKSYQDELGKFCVEETEIKETIFFSGVFKF